MLKKIISATTYLSWTKIIKNKFIIVTNRTQRTDNFNDQNNQADNYHSYPGQISLYQNNINEEMQNFQIMGLSKNNNIIDEINNVHLFHSLPFIQIENPPIKLLIDTGCCTSILRPAVAKYFYPSSVYQETWRIKTATGEKKP